jgi:BASS family bile acid:Na+ symporter
MRGITLALNIAMMAIAVAATLFHETLYAIPAAIYSLMMFGTALAFVLLITHGRPAAA